MTARRRLVAVDPRLEQLRKLTDINRAFTYTTSLDEVTRLTVEYGADLLAAAAAVLMLQDADGMLHVRAAHGIDQEKVARFRAPLTDEIIARLQGLLGVPDECFVAVPLVVGGAVTGLLAVALSRAATTPDEWLLSALADQAATAIEIARLGGEVRIEMEGRLRASEGATNAKDRALSTLAHDIRSPLGAIDGYCTILEDGMYGPLTDRQLEGIGRIRMSGRHLLSLLENVMDMARLSAGAIGVRTEDVSLRIVAREAIDMLTPAATAKRQHLSLGMGPDIVVVADAARLRQVLVNLIGNAIKFTPPDQSIVVIVLRRSVGTDELGAVSVTDTGPGVAESDRAAIFEPYFRSEGTASVPGIGLGLAISQALVKQMGGTIEVDSELGRGASFTVSLPAQLDNERSRVNEGRTSSIA